MDPIDLPSGAKFEVHPLGYEAAWGVTQTILKEIEKTEISLNGLDIKQFLASDVMSLKGPICALLSSPAILEAAKKCFAKCRYNELKIDAMTFEKKEARSDFLFCCFYALKENIAPFFASLVSHL